MIRLRDASAVFREGAPPVVTDAFALITELGGVGFLVVLLSVLYWVDDRESTATVIGYTLVGLAVVLTLKEWLAMPRPPAEVRAIAVEPESHGFPSGHAIAATVAYGGLLLARGVTDRRYRAGGIALIGLIGLSRIVIGVHYIGDVLAGYAVGLVVLGGLWATVGHRADIACAVGAVFSLAGIAVTGGSTYALLALGGSLGGAVAFRYADGEEFPRPAGLVRTGVFVAVGLAFAGTAYLVASNVPVEALAVLVNAILVAGVVLLPGLLRTEPFASLAVDPSRSS